MKILLASNSPRRKELLQILGYEILTIGSNVDEIDSISEISPIELAVKNAQLKSSKIYELHGLMKSDIIIAADTIVVLNNELFLKPNSEEDAVSMLKKLSGNVHQVITGYNLKTSLKEISGSVVSHVEFRELSEHEINSYISLGEWKDKSGGYGIQGAAASLVKEVRGSLSNIIGLPIEEILCDARAILR